MRVQATKTSSAITIKHVTVSEKTFPQKNRKIKNSIECLIIDHNNDINSRAALVEYFPLYYSHEFQLLEGLEVEATRRPEVLFLKIST